MDLYIHHRSSTNHMATAVQIPVYGDIKVQAHPDFPNLYGTGRLEATQIVSTGGVQSLVTNVTSATTLAAHDVILANATSGAITLTLPAVVAASAGVASTIGTRYYIRKSDATTNAITIAPNGTDTIDGVNASITLNVQNQFVILLASAAGAWITADYGFRQNIYTMTATGTIPAYADVVLVNSAGAATVTLPAHVSGRKLTVKSIGAGAITISPTSGTIDGAGTASLAAQYDVYQLISNGTNWFILGA